MATLQVVLDRDKTLKIAYAKVQPTILDTQLTLSTSIRHGTPFHQHPYDVWFTYIDVIGILKDINGNPLADKSIMIECSGVFIWGYPASVKTVTITTDSSGTYRTTFIALCRTSGCGGFTLDALFWGDAQYAMSTVSRTVSA